MSHTQAIRRIVEEELERRRAALNYWQQRVDSAQTALDEAAKECNIARAAVVAVTEARHALDHHDGSGM